MVTRRLPRGRRARRLTLRWRAGARHHEAGQRDGAGGSALQRDGVDAEVAEHVHDGGEAQVLYPTLAPLCEGEAQVLPTHTHTQS